MTSQEGSLCDDIMKQTWPLVITSGVGLFLCDDVMGRRPGLKQCHRRDLICCDILRGGFVSSDYFIQSSGCPQKQPPGPQANLGPGPLKCVRGSSLGPTRPQLSSPGPASDSHLILAGGAQVLGQVMAGDELQLLQRALALEGRPPGQGAPAPTTVRHPSGLW